jgi:ABC-type dipeptide/oligopeptide/nickel transport system permease subunit
MSKKYDKSLFALVQENDRLKDKPLQTKQLTYFQDAMLRFTKNKYNVIASIILMIMILMSIFVPILTPSRFYETTNSELSTLPPRIPLLENLGILDGTKLYRNQPINPDTIDPDTGLGYPTIGFVKEYIDFSTLENEIVIGTDKSPLFVGGVVELYVNTSRTSAAVISRETVVLFSGDTVIVDLASMPTIGLLEVYLSPFNVSSAITGWNDEKLVLLGTVNTSGETTLDDFQLQNATSGFLVLRYVLDAPSTNGRDKVVFNSVSILSANTNEISKSFSGFNLSMFPFFTLNPTLENGRFLRNGAEMTIASFRYDQYEALFSDQPRTLGSKEYEQILLDNPGMADTIQVDPNNPDAWTFDEGFPISEVTSLDRIVIAGREYINYKVQINGRYSLGFETTPYFIFGTDVFGKDLFVLIWLGLRTSLLLGFLATLFNIIIGIIWGATSAYYGGQVDMLMERFTDIWGSFPSITMIGIITVLIGPGFLALFIFVVYDGWIGAAKVTRFQFYRYKGSEYVLAARTLGSSDGRIIFKHILPNALGTIVTRVVLSIPSVIFLEVNLSFLGFGIGNGQTLSIGPIELTGTSIGVILNDGQQQIFAGNLWLVIFPAMIVATLMITFNMFGNALRDALNPQLRGSE